jgi:hypothetical protein
MFQKNSSLSLNRQDLEQLIYYVYKSRPNTEWTDFEQRKIVFKSVNSTSRENDPEGLILSGI